MALKIRKQFKNPDGTITEVEGTEKEIREYEKKKEKINEVPQKKKGIILG